MLQVAGTSVRAQFIIPVIFFVLLTGCIEPKTNEVIVYSALDREFSKPVLDDVGRELELSVLPRFDQESNKTVGLANAILAERNRPRCDVFWNNEILHTCLLYTSPSPRDRG